MKTATWLMTMVLGLILLSSFIVENLGADSRNDRAQVEEVINQRYVALNNMFEGDASLMLSIWSHEDDVTYLGPAGGIKVGWTAVEADWLSQAAMKLGGRVSASSTHFTIEQKMAVVVNMETGENLNSAGNIQAVSLRVTHVLRKERGKWKIISEQTDLLPFIGNGN